MYSDQSDMNKGQKDKDVQTSEIIVDTIYE